MADVNPAIATVSIPTSPVDLARAAAIARVNSNAEETKLGEESTVGKFRFTHPIPMSRFIFKSGKVIHFRGGEYYTDIKEELLELRAACRNAPIITEIGKDGEPVRDFSDVQKEQASKLLG